MNFDRPILKIIPSRTDILLERLSILGLAFVWIFTIIQYLKFPNIIPIHFNAKGFANNYGDKTIIFLVPTIISVIFIGITILNKFPHIFNYIKKITAENALTEYTKATKLLRVIKLIIVVFTVILTIDICESAKAGQSKLPWWIIPIFMISMILPIFISLYPSSKNKEKQGS